MSSARLGTRVLLRIAIVCALGIAVESCGSPSLISPQSDTLQDGTPSSQPEPLEVEKAASGVVISTEKYPADWVAQVDVNKQLYFPPIGLGERLPLEELTKDGPILDINGERIDFTGQPTALILGISDCPACLDQLPLVAKWATELPQLQLVYAARGPKLSEYIDKLRGLPGLRIVDDSGRRLAEGLTARAGPTTFLIDEQAVVRWRMTAFFPWRGNILDTAVRQFASGQPTDQTYVEANYTDAESLPQLTLTDADAKPIDIAEALRSQPTVVFLTRSNCADCREAISEVLALLDKRADANLQLVVVLDSLSTTEARLGQDYITTNQLGASTSNVLDQSGDVSNDATTVQDLLQNREYKTQLVLDPESRLATYWTIPNVPFTLFINNQGHIEDFLPFFWFSQTEDGPRTLGPTIEVMSTIVDRITNDS